MGSVGPPIEAVLATVYILPGKLRILVLGRDPTLRSAALMAGAYAFVLVGEPPEILFAALRQVQTTSAAS